MKAHTSLTSVSKKQFSGFGLWGRGEGGGLKLQNLHFGVGWIRMQEMALVWLQKMKETLSSCVNFFGTPWNGSREDSHSREESSHDALRMSVTEWTFLFGFVSQQSLPHTFLFRATFLVYVLDTSFTFSSLSQTMSALAVSSHGIHCLPTLLSHTKRPFFLAMTGEEDLSLWTDPLEVGPRLFGSKMDGGVGDLLDFRQLCLHHRFFFPF